MSWTRPPDLRAQVQRLWDRGELLAALVPGANDAFPRRLILKGPTSSEVTDRFDDVRTWIAELKSAPRCRVEMRQFNHRVFGSNAIPESVWIDSLDDALTLIGKTREAKQFRAMLELTQTRNPVLLAWLGKRPLLALSLSDRWKLLLDIVSWIHAHPRPDIYLRQVDIPGAHSKFIEAHRSVLADLLNLTLPPEAIDTSLTGTGQFTARYGFRDKPTRIRFRVLDDKLIVLPGIRQPDIALDAQSFADLDIAVRRAFITENETNFLAFPAMEDSIVIFGAGYGWGTLAKARWLTRCAINYWGDIDTHGFAILDQLRNRFDHVESFLMDRATLIAHEASWGREDSQVLHDLPRLTAAERALFDELRDNRLGKGLRLEQEMVRFGWLESALRSVLG